MHPLYSLTAMTGREAAESRTVVFGTFELNQRLLVVLLGAFPFGILAAALTWVLLGQLAIFMIPLVMVVAAFLFYRRSTKGLRLRTYRALLDTRGGEARRIGKFHMCGQVVDTSMAQFRRVEQATVPYAAPVSVPRAALAAETPGGAR